MVLLEELYYACMYFTADGVVKDLLVARLSLLGAK